MKKVCCKIISNTNQKSVLLFKRHLVLQVFMDGDNRFPSGDMLDNLPLLH